MAVTPLDPPYPKTPCCAHTSRLVSSIEPDCPSKFYIAGIGISRVFCCCDLDVDPMTFIYERDPYPLKMYHPQTENELSTSRLLKVLHRQTYIHIVHADRQTNRHNRKHYHAASRSHQIYKCRRKLIISTLKLSQLSCSFFKIKAGF